MRWLVQQNGMLFQCIALTQSAFVTASMLAFGLVLCQAPHVVAS